MWMLNISEQTPSTAVCLCGTCWAVNCSSAANAVQTACGLCPWCHILMSHPVVTGTPPLCWRHRPVCFGSWPVPAGIQRGGRGHDSSDSSTQIRSCADFKGLEGEISCCLEENITGTWTLTVRLHNWAQASPTLRRMNISHCYRAAYINTVSIAAVCFVIKGSKSGCHGNII